MNLYESFEELADISLSLFSNPKCITRDTEFPFLQVKLFLISQEMKFRMCCFPLKLSLQVSLSAAVKFKSL